MEKFYHGEAPSNFRLNDIYVFIFFVINNILHETKARKSHRRQQISLVLCGHLPAVSFFSVVINIYGEKLFVSKKGLNIQQNTLCRGKYSYHEVYKYSPAYLESGLMHNVSHTYRVSLALSFSRGRLCVQEVFMLRGDLAWSRWCKLLSKLLRNLFSNSVLQIAPWDPGSLGMKHLTSMYTSSRPFPFHELTYMSSKQLLFFTKEENKKAGMAPPRKCFRGKLLQF